MTSHPAAAPRHAVPFAPAVMVETRPRDGSHPPEPDHGPFGRRVLPAEGIEDIQILDEEGRASDRHVPDLTDTELLRIYRAMVLTRKFDVRMLNMQRQGQMGTFAPGYGQEATQIGQVYWLKPEDWYAPSYRSFGAQIWRGWPMEHLMLLWDGFHEGFAPPAHVNDLPFSIVIGSHVPLATGVAMAQSYREEKHVTLCNFGDGASSEGAVHEAMNFAAVYRAPVVFVLENNGYAISTTTQIQSRVDAFARRATGYAMPGVRVDGNDVLGMLVACREAIDRARAGEGPTLIEAVTYRMGVHTTADDPKVYRDDEEVSWWEQRCPIARFEKWLTARGVLDASAPERIAGECEQQVLAARDAFRERMIARPEDLFDFVYESLPGELEGQKREYFERLRRKGAWNKDA